MDGQPPPSSFINQAANEDNPPQTSSTDTSSSPPNLSTDALRQAQIQAAQLQILQRLNNNNGNHPLRGNPPILGQTFRAPSATGMVSANPGGGVGGNSLSALSVPMPTMTRSGVPVPTTFSTPYIRTPSSTFSAPTSALSVVAQLARPMTPSSKGNASILSGIEGKSPPIEVVAAIRDRLATVPSYDPQMDEPAFRNSLMQFMQVVNCPIKKMPMIRPDRPLPMLRLFQLVTSYGGFKAVSEANRWPAVAVSLEIHPFAQETIASLQKLYASMLFAYEQVYFLKLPLERIIWPQQIIHSLNLQEQRQRSATTAGAISEQSLAEKSVKKDTTNEVEQPSTPSETKRLPGPQPPVKSPTPINPLFTNSEGKTPLAAPLEKVNLEQESSPMGELFRMTQKAKRAFFHTLNIGKLAIEELILILGSSNDLMVGLALATLERCAWENVVLTDMATLECLVDALLSLALSCEQRLPIVDGPKTMTLSPFEFLAKCEESKTQGLLTSAKYDENLARLNSIVYILKGMISTYQEGFPMQKTIAKNEKLLEGWLIPLLYDKDRWCRVGLEIYNNLWTLFNTAIPFCSALSEELIRGIVSNVVLNIHTGLEQSMQWAHVLCPTILLQDGLVENHRRLSRFLSFVPPRVFVSIDCIMKLFFNPHALEAVIKENGRIDAESPLSAYCSDLMDDLIRLAELFLPVYTSFVKNSMDIINGSTNDANTYAINVGKFLHNPHCCLTDGGYLELSLQAIMVLVKRMEFCSIGQFYERIAWLSLQIVNSTRFLYQISCPLSGQPGRSSNPPYIVMIEGRPQSILKQQGIVAHYSNPIRLYQLGCLLLNLMSKNNNWVLESNYWMVEMAANWLTEELSEVHRDLLYSPDLDAFINRLL